MTERTEEELEPRTPWWEATLDGLSIRAWIGIGLAIAAGTIGFGAWWTYGLGG